MFADTSQTLAPELNVCGPSASKFSEDFRDMDNNEMMPLSNYVPQLNSNEDLVDGSADAGVSKWHMKGKRNNRNVSKRSMDLTDGKMSSDNYNDGSIRDSMYQSRGRTFKSERIYQAKEEFLYDYDDSDLIENHSHMIPLSDYEVEGTSHVGRKPILIDVDLKVQASYQGEHVPLVSLMSRLNGKAIVGHPVQIEILEDGSTAQLLMANNVSLDESTAPRPFWRTGRRTAMQRVPRSNPITSTLEGDYDNDDEKALLYSDWEMKAHHLKKHSIHNHKAQLAKRSISRANRPSSVKFQKKLFKRTNLSSQKIRTLSSIAIEKKLGGETGDVLGSLIKPEGAAPLVTCVPVKVVFSRILEAVGRSPIAVSHRLKMASPAVRDNTS